MATTQTDRFVRIEGLNTRYRDQGSGPAVVLLHGAAVGSSLDVWDRSLDALVARGLRIVVFDRPGFGRTDDADDTSAAFQRQFILKLLDTLGIETAGLVGHSATGSYVVQLALDHPERIDRIMVLGTGSMLPPIQGVVSGPPPGESGPEDREPNRDDVRAVLESQLYDHSLITPELIEARYQVSLGHRRRAAGGGAAASAGGAAPSVPLWQRLGELTMPFMMLYGREDRGSVPERATLLSERYPDIDIRILDHCKHLVQLDRADAFIGAVGDFFAG